MLWVPLVLKSLQSVSRYCQISEEMAQNIVILWSERGCGVCTKLLGLEFPEQLMGSRGAALCAPKCCLKHLSHLPLLTGTT